MWTNLESSFTNFLLDILLCTMALVFKDINCLNAIGGLHSPDQVLEYFYYSPFYDKTSDNEALRMQGNVGYEHLLGLKGTQYICNETIKNPGDLCTRLYVIKKIRRNSARSFDVLDVYYCLDGEIYRVPDVYEVVKTRYQVTAHEIKKGFDTLIETFKNDTNSTVMFPSKDTLHHEKSLRGERSRRHNSIMSQFPGMNDVFKELEEMSMAPPRQIE